MSAKHNSNLRPPHFTATETNRISRNKACALVGVLSVVGFGCAEDLEPQDTTNRVFDGVEIQQQLEGEPDATFFVDLREPQTYSFDQTEVDIEFSHFMVQCPSMDFPIPMEDFAQTLGISLEQDTLTLWSADFDLRLENTYRSETITEVECDDEGEDCVVYTWELPDA